MQFHRLTKSIVRQGIIIGLIVFAAIMAIDIRALAAYCGHFNFSRLGETDLTRHVQRSLARIYKQNAGNEDQHEGAATVIDLNPMLLVTASHVVPEDTALVRFPTLNDQFYHAKVIVRSVKSQHAPGIPEHTAEVEAQDFAVLQVDNPPSVGVEQLEIWLDEVDKDVSHAFAGFARDLPDAVWGGGKLAQKKECAWRLRETTFNGDSGGAAVSPGGLLVGIVLDGREGGRFDQGAMGQATILPLHCVQDEILAALDKASPRKGSNILDANRAVLLHVLQPPASSGWINNLKFARGLRDLMNSPTLLRKLRVANAITCPLFKSTIDRKLGYDMAARLVERASLTSKDAGDIFKALGEQQTAENPALAKLLFASSQKSYTTFIEATSSVAGSNNSVKSALAQAALGRAEVVASLAALSDDGYARTVAVVAAARAVKATKDTSLHGLALATLGNYALKAGDYQTAIEAFTSAKKAGFSTTWTKDDYIEAFRRKDNVINAASAADYSPLGSYNPLTETKLDVLTTRALIDSKP